MRTICLYFEIHQIIHLKRYRFFDIGTNHYYYDDYANETSINEVAERSYIPALNTLIEMVKNSDGAFKVALSCCTSSMIRDAASSWPSHTLMDFLLWLMRIALRKR